MDGFSIFSNNLKSVELIQFGRRRKTFGQQKLISLISLDQIKETFCLRPKLSTNAYIFLDERKMVEKDEIIHR